MNKLNTLQKNIFFLGIRMSITEYIEKMKKIQNSLLIFLEEKNDDEEKYENL